MFKYAVISITIITYFLGCVPEAKFSKPDSPALLVNQIRHAFAASNSGQLYHLIIDKKDLISALTEENIQTAYAYDAHLFTMATDDNTYEVYKKRLLESYYTIKKKPLNWAETSIKKATYKTDSLQISLRGTLLIKDDKNMSDSIHFRAVKLLNTWSLTELY